jgi:hypothetical protein
MNIEENNKLIAEFMGYKFIENCSQSTDLYEAGDRIGEDSIENIWVLNPTEKFFELKRFGMWVSEDYYNNEKPYDNYIYENSLQYNESWDWLMPCIGKISNKCKELEELDGLKYALLTNNIEEAWKFVVSYLLTYKIRIS